jgi:hypothetical protein
MKNWTEFNRAYDRGASHDQLLAIARKMTGTDHAAAMRVLNPTKRQRQESAQRQAAINATTRAEIDTHCQLTGLPKF